MKRLLSFKLLAVVAVAGLTGLGVAIATGSSSPSITHKLDKITMDPSMVKVHTKPAIAHKPFDMVDKSGKKVSADTMLDIPGGKKVRAGEYYAKLNDMESKFNKIGYSLRDKKDGKTLLQETKIDEAELENHSKKVHSLHRPFDPKTMKPVRKREELEKLHHAFVKAHAAAPKKNAADPTPGTTGPAKTTSWKKNWNYTMGNKKLMAGYLSGNLDVRGSKDDVALGASARAGGYLMGREINIVRASGTVVSPVKGPSKGSLHVYLLGQHVINLDKSVNTTWSLSDKKSHGIDVHAEYHFSIGPVPMVARLGARGEAGVRYLFAIRPGAATFQVIPFVTAKVYAECGVDAFLVSAGGGGEITLMKDELRIGAELAVTMDSAKGPMLTEHIYAQNTLEMLSGRVYAWARVNYLFGSHEWHYDLWKWKGFHTNGYLFNDYHTTQLIPGYSVATK
ncbi:MAG: hypothetical protein U0793_23835 [Gemmataceae bacterium]